MASPTLSERCSQVDSEIKARQEKFGVDLYELLDDNDFGIDESLSSKSFLHNLQIQFRQANDDILKYRRRMPERNKRRRRLRVGSINNQIADQYVVQRKRRFGVESFDLVFDVLGTTSKDSISFLSKLEQKIHVIIKKAVNDVLDLERKKELMLQEEDGAETENEDILCGAFNVLCSSIVCF